MLLCITNYYHSHIFLLHLLYGHSHIFLHSHSQGSRSLLQQLRYWQTQSIVEHKLTFNMKLENASCLIHDDKQMNSNSCGVGFQVRFFLHWHYYVAATSSHSHLTGSAIHFNDGNSLSRFVIFLSIFLKNMHIKCYKIWQLLTT